MYTIVTRVGEIIAKDVPWPKLQLLLGRNEEGNPKAWEDDGTPILYHAPMVVLHGRKRRDLCHAVVEKPVILAEIKRRIYHSVPCASSNFTVVKARYSNEVGSGRYWEHNTDVCHSYATAACASKELASVIAASFVRKPLNEATSVVPEPLSAKTTARTVRSIVLRFPERPKTSPPPEIMEAA